MKPLMKRKDGETDGEYAERTAEALDTKREKRARNAAERADMAEHHLVTRFPWLDGVYSVVRRTGRKTPGLHPYVCPLAPAGSLAACAPPRCLPRRVFYETGTKRGRNRDEIQVRERARTRAVPPQHTAPARPLDAAAPQFLRFCAR